MGERADSLLQEGPDRGQRALIIDRLYDVALDPIRLKDLLELWEAHIAGWSLLGGGTPGALDDPEIDLHLARASVFLQRFDTARGEVGYRALLAEIPRLAAFICDGNGRVVACNRAATVAFRVAEDASLAALPVEPADVMTLGTVVRRVASGRAEGVATLRIRSTVTGGPVIVRVSPVDGGDMRPLALVLSTELVWPEGFAATVQEAFSLTPAEVEIVRGITLGLPIRDIAEARRRSVDTVRTQMRSILAKTETHSQAELVRVVLGLMDVTLTPLGPLEPAPLGGALEPVPRGSLLLPDGRRLDWLEFGDPAGAACLYLHGELGLSRWPASAEREAKARGIRVIVPIRAGYGRSDAHPKGAEPLTAVTLDCAAVLDHLGVERVAVLALAGDLRFAANLALLLPGRVSGILGCAARLPLRTAVQHERMERWQRLILTSARFAPKMLSFLAQAAFTLARRVGKTAFLTDAYGASPADLAAFAEPEVRDAVLEGSGICIGARGAAHEAFTRDSIGALRDWGGILRSCRVPVLLLQGDQDPLAPEATIRELLADYPEVESEFLSHSGQLLFFSRWLHALDRLEDILPR